MSYAWDEDRPGTSAPRPEELPTDAPQWPDGGGPDGGTQERDHAGPTPVGEKARSRGAPSATDPPEPGEHPSKWLT